MSNISFSPSAWDDYLYWQSQDKKTLKKINQILQDIQRDSFSGIGKPEPLRYRADCWSRRINDKDRLVYAVDEERNVLILSCRGHYED